jgi:hypothetical protein
MDLPSKLTDSLQHLKDWVSIVTTAKQAYDLDCPPVPFATITSCDAPSQELGLVDSPSMMANRPTYLAVHNLKKSFMHHRKSQWNQILVNIYTAAFVLHWHSPVSTGVMYPVLL